MNYLSALNDKQLEAVKETEGYLRVIAGAGSGKTKLLVSRYAYLVKEYGIDSANILCVTFTNKAAGEMKRRIRGIIGQEYDTSLICTYHGFCVRVLHEDIEKIFYPKEFQIIDTAQQKSILSEIYQKFELKLDNGSFEKIIKLISLKKSDRKYVAKMCSSEKCQILEDVKTQDDQIAEEFLQRQKQIYAMDFNDLMYFTLDIFSRCPDVLKKWQDRLNYIQVDEFQDSSVTEMELIDMISSKHKNLMIVGDPDQNIYEWRGSDVKLLVDFDKTHENTKTVFLNQNYRSTPQILKCANTLIDNNQYRLKKDLFTRSDDGAKVYHYHTKNEYDEADKIIEIIRISRKNDKTDFSDFAVLYRSGFLSRVIEKKFTENGVPYEIFGGVKFYQRMEIQDIMAYLRLVAFDDDASFKRIVNTPRRRFGRTKLQRVQILQDGEQSLFETLKENIDDPIFKSSGAKKFTELIDDIRTDCFEIPLSECVERICAESGYEKYIRELGDMERFENLSEFKRIVCEYEKNYGENVSLKEFINQISLQSEDEGEESPDRVKMMTIHAAKGLEFPNVFVVGFSEGVFPSAKTIEERKLLGLEEERRLCYVAITRAEKRLFLLDSEGYTQNGKQKLPSRFLKEIGEENYIRIGNISKELQDGADKFASSLCGEPSRDTISIGEEVEHPAFGKGRIIGYGKNGNSYIVKFHKLSSERVLSKDFFSKEHSLPVITPPVVENSRPIGINEEKAEEEQFEERFKDRFKDELSLEKTTTEEKSIDGNNWLEGYEAVTTETVPEYITDKKETTVIAEKENEVPQTPNLSEYDNLWKREDVPKKDWVCVGVTDLGAPVGVCQMCGYQIIRYVHHMQHPNYHPLNVGCICAGKMEGDIERAKQRERDFKNKQTRRENFKKRKWKISKNNNSYIKIKNHLIVLYYNKRFDNWKYSIDNVFCAEVYPTKEEAMDGAFEALESKR